MCGKKLPTKEWNGTRCVECVEKNFQQKNGMELDVLNVWKKLDDLISYYYICLV